MAGKKSEVEMERFVMDKTVRALVRLKHSLAADRELNDTLPDMLKAFDDGVQRGELRKMLPPKVDEFLNDK